MLCQAVERLRRQSLHVTFIFLLALSCTGADVSAAAPQNIVSAPDKETSGLDPKVDARSRIAVAISVNDGEGAIDAYLQLISLLTSDDDVNERALALLSVGALLRNETRFDEARGYLNQALPLIKTYYTARPEKIIECLFLLVDLELDQGNTDAAVKIFKEAEPFLASPPDLDIIAKARWGATLIRLYVYHSDATRTRGEGYLREVISATEGKKDALSKNLLQQATFWLATSLDRAGKSRSAKPLAIRALELANQYRPEGPSATGRAASPIARAEQLVGLIALHDDRPAEAVAYLERSLKTSERLPDIETSLREARLALVVAKTDLGRFDEAKGLIERQLTIDRQNIPLDDLRYGSALSVYGNLLIQTKKFFAALGPLRKAVAIYQSKSADPQETFNVMLQLAQTYGQARYTCETRKAYEALLPVARQLKSPKAEDMKVIETNIRMFQREGFCTGSRLAVSQLPPTERAFLGQPIDSSTLDQIRSADGMAIFDGIHEEAEASLREVLNSPKVANDKYVSAYVLGHLANVIPAERGVERMNVAQDALRLTLALYPPDSLPVLERYSVLLTLLQQAEPSPDNPQHRQTALTAFRILSNHENDLPPDSVAPLSFAVGRSLALTNTELGRAKTLLTRARERYSAAQPSQLDLVADCDLNLAITASRARNFDELEMYARRAIELAPKAKPGDAVYLASAVEYLGIAHLQRGQAAYALDSLREASGLWEKVNAKSWDYARVLWHLTEAHTQLKQWQDAAAVGSKALNVGSLQPEHRARTSALVGMAYAKLNSPEAEMPLRTAISYYEKGTEQDRDAAALASGFLVDVLVRGGKSCEAQTILRKLIVRPPKVPGIEVKLSNYLADLKSKSRCDSGSSKN